MTRSFLGLDGAPALDAQVYLRAWPNDLALHGLAIGGEVRTVTIGVGEVDARGNYAITPDLTGLSADYVTAHGRVNTELDAIANVDMQGGAQEQMWNTVLDDSSQTVAFDLATQQVTASSPSTTAHVGVQSARRPTGVTPNPGGPGGGCGYLAER